MVVALVKVSMYDGLSLNMKNANMFFLPFYWILDKKVAGKSKAEQIEARQQELERRLQDVSGQLGSGKKSTKKGESAELVLIDIHSGLFSVCLTHFSHKMQQTNHSI